MRFSRREALRAQSRAFRRIVTPESPPTPSVVPKCCPGRLGSAAPNTRRRRLCAARRLRISGVVSRAMQPASHHAGGRMGSPVRSDPRSPISLRSGYRSLFGRTSPSEVSSGQFGAGTAWDRDSRLLHHSGVVGELRKRTHARGGTSCETPGVSARCAARTSTVRARSRPARPLGGSITAHRDHGCSPRARGRDRF